MAFRLKHEETAAHGVRRLAAKQLRSARDQLRKSAVPADEAIHEARKSLKKTRALLQLIDADGGRVRRKEEKALRDVSGVLSRLRDADAMIEILEKLRRRNPRLLSEHAFARVRRRLRSNRQAAMKDAKRDGIWSAAVRTLGRLRDAARDWRQEHRGFGALAAGLRKAHKDGRNAMARARRTERAGDFHEWRKQAKTLWYELRLIEAAGPRIRGDVRALHAAESALGDDHNLVVLCETLAKDTSVCSREDLDRIRPAADRFQCQLRKKAVAACGRIYEPRSGEFVRGVRRAWKTWRRRTHNNRRDARLAHTA